jgi:hypothetical protein
VEIKGIFADVYGIGIRSRGMCRGGRLGVRRDCMLDLSNTVPNTQTHVPKRG